MPVLRALRAAPKTISAFAVSASLCAPVSAVAQETSAITQQVVIYAAGTAGGGVDLFGRLLGRHIGRHIEGAPNVVVQVMPGAGGIRAANYLVQSAPRDGSAMAIFAGGPILEPLIGDRNPGYDMSQFTWIGAISKDVSLCIVRSESPVKSFADATQRQVVVAGTGAGSETDTFPVVLNELLGSRFKVVTGYLGSQQTILAIESGEVDGRCGWSLSSLKSTKPDWLRDKRVNVLLQMGLKKSPEMPDAPLVLDLAKTEEDKQLLTLLLGTTAISRPFVAPPGLPEGKARNLRRAFDATMKDPAFLAEAAAMRADVEPTTGEEVQAIVAAMYATPKPVVERVKKLLGK
ncbi:MAG: tripartite tricarboxylate transporter substrate-binding protein [Beijerinckiaceae bacterium]|nr:tripartite tricarboxylate transporter substrate-binding protein [Beijerinckiaceae bacterium]